MNLFMREVRATIGSRTIEEPLTIYFDIPFDDGDKVNDISIKIFNLSDNTINGFKNGQRVILTAGYKGDAGTIFDGKLKKVSTEWESVDKITTFLCIDDKGNFLSTKVKKTYAANTNAKTILNDLIGKSGLSIGELSLPTNFVYRSGKTINGKLGTAVIAIAKDCKAKVHINRNKIYIRDKNKGNTIAFEVSKETGLIDNPTVIEDETNDVQKKKKIKRTGYSLNMLLNHRITVDSLIQLNSKTVKGLFRVEKGKHSGSNRDDEFYTYVEVYPL